MDERSAAVGGELAVGSTAFGGTPQSHSQFCDGSGLRHTASQSDAKFRPTGRGNGVQSLSCLTSCENLVGPECGTRSNLPKMRRWTSELSSHSGVFHRSLLLHHFGLLGPAGCVRQGWHSHTTVLGTATWSREKLGTPWW